MKRFFAILLSFLLMLSLGGCYDYRSLDELTIVAGIAIDLCDTENQYRVTLEILDTAAASDSSERKTELIVSEGQTIFDAIFNANKQLRSEMYFGNTGVLIVGHQLAEEEGLNFIMDAIMRDFSLRDTVSIVISKEDSAKALLDYKSDEGVIISYEIESNLNAAKLTTTSIRPYPLYKIYNYLSADAEMYNLPLPAFGFEEVSGEQEDKETEEGAKKEKILLSNGMAIFSKDKLVDWFDDEYMPYYLFLTEELSGGTFVFFLEDEENSGKQNDEKQNPEQDVTIQVENSKAEMDYVFSEDKFILKAHVDVNCSIVEAPPSLSSMDADTVNQITLNANETLAYHITDMIQEMQKTEHGGIFGFGKYLYRHNPKLWDSVKDNWQEYFSDADVEITCDFIIEDSGILKRYEADDNDDD